MAQNPTPSKLDQHQVFQRAFDEASDRLRVDTVASIEPGSMEVVISQADDSILAYGNDGSANRAIKTDAAGELQIDVLTSALPSGASTSAKQDTGNTSLSSIDTKLTNASQKSQIVDGSGNVISSTSNALDVNIKSGITIDVNLDNADDDVLAYGYDGSTNRAIKTDASGELQIDVLTSALPSGAATETTLSGIRTDRFASTGTTTSITRSATVQTALVSNSSRKGFVLWNDGNASCYIRFGAGATTTTFTIVLGGNSGYEPGDGVMYTGIITAIWSSGGAGTLLSTELT